MCIRIPYVLSNMCRPAAILLLTVICIVAGNGARGYRAAGGSKIQDVATSSTVSPSGGSTTTPLKDGKIGQISKVCRECLCLLFTGCDTGRGCVIPKRRDGPGPGYDYGDCGPYHISYPFWTDANNFAMTLNDVEMLNGWRSCANDLVCSSTMIQKYSYRYPVDCNRDGRWDCVDYAAVHSVGPVGCLDPATLADWNRVHRSDIRGFLHCLVLGDASGYYATKYGNGTANAAATNL